MVSYNGAVVTVLLYLVGSSLCVIPEGEYQFGPVFGHNNLASRFLGHKYFEAFFDKGALKPLIAKKLLLGVGAVGAGALAAGAAGLYAKKHHGGGGGWSSGPLGGLFGKGQASSGGGGWYDQQQQHYPSASVGGGGDYNGQYQYGQSYPIVSPSYQDQGSYAGDGGSGSDGYNYNGWSQSY